MSDTPNPPQWLNLGAIVADDTVAELGQLSDRIEAVTTDLVPLLDSSYRTLRRVANAISAAQEASDDSASDTIYDVVFKYSSAERLSDLLYLLAAHAQSAAGENVSASENVSDMDGAIEWLAKARADLGLDQWNVPAVRAAQS